MYPFERFSEDAKRVLTLAQEEAERAHHSYIGTEHLLLGLMRQDGLGGRALTALGLEISQVRKQIELVLGRNERIIIQQIIPTSRVKKVIEMAFEEARREGSNYVGSDHLLLALLQEGEGIAAHVLDDMGVTVAVARTEIERLLAAGVQERGGGHGAPVRAKHRSLDVADAEGRPIHVEVVYPAGYSDPECEGILERVRAAIVSRI
ncbi:MAG TPA: Clp protease N-terminal domain-containing protein [Candidatus Limnocylindrales bacterium]|nr:Clp protease N-terminal domain-containing protein [Candidatus Limnocylindrales bacterium]